MLFLCLDTYAIKWTAKYEGNCQNKAPTALLPKKTPLYPQWLGATQIRYWYHGEDTPLVLPGTESGHPARGHSLYW
jgi:hypothetical protein